MAKNKTYRLAVAPEKKVINIPPRIVEKKYQINDCLVATRPISEVLYEDKYFEAQICYAEYQGKWDWGVHYTYKGSGVGCGGGGCLPNFSTEYGNYDLFTSKESARQAAIKWLHDYFARKGDHPYGKSNKPVLDACQRALNPQLTLF